MKGFKKIILIFLIIISILGALATAYIVSRNNKGRFTIKSSKQLNSTKKESTNTRSIKNLSNNEDCCINQ